MAYIQNKRIVIAKVRVSGGHLCEAKAPTEPAGETAARRAAIRTPPVIARGFSPVAIRFSFKGNTDSFALITLAAPAVARFFLHRRRSQRHSE